MFTSLYVGITNYVWKYLNYSYFGCVCVDCSINRDKWEIRFSDPC